MLKRYQYPEKVDEENLKKLIERAKEITNKSRITFVASVIVSMVLGFVIIIVYFAPFLKIAQNAQTAFEMAFAISFGIALFVSAFLIDFVNVFFMRRILNIIPYYPRPEEFVFAQCILTATIFDKFPKSDWARVIRYRSMWLSEEFSRFTKFDEFNFRRKVYAKEFGLLGSGETQIARMLMFSEGNKKELLTDFALAFVNNNDIMAFRSLSGLINEIEEYGKLEIRSERILNQLKKWKSVIAIIGGAVAIIAAIVGLFVH